MKPSDYYMKPEDRKQNEVDEIIMPDAKNLLFIITKYAPNDKFPHTIDMQLEVGEGNYKGVKISTRFSMVKKDGSPNAIAKRIHSEICDEAFGGQPNEFWEMVGKTARLNYKRTATENGVYHNVSVPYKSKLKSKVPPLNQGEPIPGTISTESEDITDDIPF